MTFDNPDFVRYAEAYGAKGWRIHAAGELAPILRSALESGGIHVVTTSVDYTENSRVLIEELQTNLSSGAFERS
jgi:acetolactate synthase-1/2/3 large subunit